MRIRAWMVAMAWVVGATPALADMPPPDGYVESCTAAKQQTPTSECLECPAWVSHRNRCTTFLGPYCYTKVCQSYGASAWTEVFCRTKDASAPAVPSDVLGKLNAATGDEPPDSPDGGTVVAPSTCAPYSPPTATGTQTTTSTSGDGSGCTVSGGTSATRAVGLLALALFGLALVGLRRRSRR